MMRQTGQTMGINGSGLAATSLPVAALTQSGGAEAGRKRVETVVETLANLRGGGESLAEVAHDARNMVTALGLYCDLLEEPGVLTAPYAHYGNELRLVATASRRLVEKLLALDVRLGGMESLSTSNGLLRSAVSSELQMGSEASSQERARRWVLMPAEPIKDLAGELTANRNLLAALAGASIDLTLDVEGGARPVRMTGEDLTRILVNLVKNAAEAMPDGGRIQLGLRAQPAAEKAAEALNLTVEDNGPGIPRKALERIFDSGYTTRGPEGSASAAFRQNGWPATHRGLGLSITRSIVEAAGGRIHAANRAPTGARFEIELPVRSR
jgi:signal transduction histidine kinase